MDAIEIFSGAGGLALGVELAGISKKILIEKNENAVKTLRINQEGGKYFKKSIIENMDVRNFNFGELEEEIDIVAGGPPCQPFSMAGKRLGDIDGRDMFPETFAIIDKVRPKVFVLENVPGIKGLAWGNYIEYLRLRLSLPSLKLPSKNGWEKNLAYLQKYVSSSGGNIQQYSVTMNWANAADYGVPQKRLRLFIVGIRSDLKINWSFPTPTHSENSLLWDQWITGDYWEKSRLRNRHLSTNSYQLLRHRLGQTKNEESMKMLPWPTVRDAISDLPKPARYASRKFTHHELREGARIYEGHTGSILDYPAKAIKAGVHGVPGGENMIRLSEGVVRYMTVREAARLQSFPDDFTFHGGWSQTMMQIGNAVPVKLAQVVVSSVIKALRKSTLKTVDFGV